MTQNALLVVAMASGGAFLGSIVGWVSSGPLGAIAGAGLGGMLGAVAWTCIKDE